MLELLIVVVRAFTLALRGHRELVLDTWRCGNNWRPSIDRAERETWSYRDFLTLLATEEIAHRQQTRLA